jgi:multidrug efflux pump subunit AcrA (membrane-fusion protein)
MFVRGLSFVFAVVSIGAGMARAQTLPTTARLESVPLELIMPERYQVAENLVPIRRVTLVAPADGFVRSMESRLGASVKEGQEIAQLDRNEFTARVKMAAAEVREKEAELKANSSTSDVVRAQLEAAQARVELAQVALDRCTLRAPFTGRLVSLPVCAGQYVTKGTILAELADVTALKVLVPVDRRTVSSGAPLTVQIEGQDVAGKVQAILPLPAHFITLRELATPFAAAWVLVPNAKGELEPGLRVRPVTIPVAPIATVARRAVKREKGNVGDTGMVQVIRNEYVLNVPVRILGDTGPERTQITGLFRMSDALIVSASVPLLPGTLLRFGDASNRGVEGVAPDPSLGGTEAGLTHPGASLPPSSARTSRGAAAPTKPATPSSGSSSTPY